MSTNVVPNPGTKHGPDDVGAEPLVVALVGPAEERRWAMAKALVDSQRASVREFISYPAGRDEFQLLLDQSFDVVIIDLDSDPDVAQGLVEQASASRAATVMVYSEKADTKLAVRFMRAGAREYLLLPLERGVVEEALVRAGANVRPKARPAEKTLGKVLVLLGAKGGSGVTTIACNLAVNLARESEHSTLLIDLAAPIGDAALTLGLATDYSTEDALQNAARLDASFLKRLLVKHSSGLFVLAAPSTVPEVEASKLAIDKLISMARRNFDHVIVDVGSRIELAGTALFKDATAVYLVTLTGISDLRNSNRLISQFFSEGGPKLEIVVNRFEPKLIGGVREDVVVNALGRPVQWKIPDDHDAARESKTGETGQTKTRISRLTQEMANAVTGRTGAAQEKEKEKKRGFGFKGFGRSIADKVSGNDDPPSISIVPQTNQRPNPTVTMVPQADPRPTPSTQIAPPPRERANSTISIVPPVNAPATPSNSIAPPAREHAIPNLPIAQPVKVRAIPSISIAPPIIPIESPARDRATPAISWPSPHQITYGDALSSSQLNAAASVAGTFEYSPELGEVLPAGTHTLSVTFTPTNSSDYATTQATVSLKVAMATPTVEWSSPDPIPYGTPLSSAQLSATASVLGTFEYSPPLDEVLTAGAHTLSVTFTPTDSANCATVQTTVSLTVDTVTPTITWTNPDPIAYGTPLGTPELSATASVPGTFDYFPAPGEVLAAGTHPLSVIFSPTDSANYATAQATVPLVVAMSTSTIEWSNPEAITYGTLLGATQLCARASAPGTFEYSPARGSALAAGTHPLSVIFVPTDSANITAAQATVSLDVAKAMPAIAWPNPDSIQYGTLLGATQLSATASVPGTLDYSPAPGEMLPPGSHTLSVAFTSTDSVNYATARATVSLNVTRATPVIEWSNPDPITYGEPLKSTQLCATSSVPGTFDYSPASGEVLPPGLHKLTVTFTPADSANYATAQATVSFKVARIQPVVKWPDPTAITYGTPLSTSKLCATASEPGTFDYSPGPGALLTAGTHTLSATFNATDSANCATAQATVSITVAKATPVVTWSNPDSIPYGTQLSDAQLCATAPVPGTFDYSPAPFEVLPPGTHTLSVTFTPEDSVSYSTTQASVPITVAAPTPLIAWSNPDRIACGTLPNTTLRSNTVGFPERLAHSGAADHAALADSAWVEVTNKRVATEANTRETRTYKGAVYEKGDDGQWHLQQI